MAVTMSHTKKANNRKLKFCRESNENVFPLQEITEVRVMTFKMVQLFCYPETFLKITRQLWLN